MYAVREPRAAGIFYSSDRQMLQRELESSYSGKDGPGAAESDEPKAVIAPHDRMRLCGPACAWAYSRAGRANYIIIGANHFDVGSRFAIMKEGLWKTPLGEVVISNRVAQKIIDKSGFTEYDVISHEREHSIEVQLPFIQHRFGNEFKIVPIAIRNNFDDYDFLKQCQSLGKAVAQSVMAEKERWVVVGTTDLSSGPRTQVEKADKSIINSLKNLNVKKFFSSVHDSKSYICGYGAVIAAITAAKEMGARKSSLLKYMTATEAVRGGRATVGYASLMVK